MRIQLLTDNPNSWIIPYVKELQEQLEELYPEHEILRYTDHSEVQKGDVLCLLACERIFKDLELNSHNLVVHESDLPKGKGWSPVTWQVLEGKTKIPVTLFEATKEIDAGQIYAKDYILLEGHELLPEIKHQQGLITNKLIVEFIKNFPQNKGKEQIGEESFYPRRTPKDAELDIDKSISDNFDLLRVSDNERYPAFFYKNGIKYIVKISKENG